MAAKAKRVGERDLLRNVRQSFGHDIDGALRIGSANPAVGGMQSRATESADPMASTAPAAPSVWPSCP